jgi:anhydro-N-acetylmuramic acid kinase
MTMAGLFVGLMSGTSMDSIDAVLARIEGQGFHLVATHDHSWPESLRQRLLDLRMEPTVPLRELGELDALCGETFAAAAQQLIQTSGLPATAVAAIGSHGQTLYHHPHPPAPFSIQIGDPNLIAQRTGITTVADFRRRDMAAGGQGAPLVPLFHQALFRHPRRNRVILNIGGIANLTLLPAGGGKVQGFDSGPGNCLMDQWCRLKLDHPFDRDGEWANRGQVNGRLLQRLLADPYFDHPPPKSTGTEYFSLRWLQQHLEAFPETADEDIQATLLALTIETMAGAISRWAPQTGEVLVCGGGSHNRRLMEGLARSLGPVELATTEREGIHPDWVEAAAFAWLAARTLASQAGNLPSATGASEAVILGGIYPATP